MKLSLLTRTSMTLRSRMKCKSSRPGLGFRWRHEWTHPNFMRRHSHRHRKQMSFIGGLVFNHRMLKGRLRSA